MIHFKKEISMVIKTVNPKGNQPWIFIGKTDAEAEVPILCPPGIKSWFTGKDPDAGKKLKAGEEGDVRGWDGWMVSPTQWTWVWANSERWWWTREAWCAVVHGVTKSRAQLSDWTGLNWCIENILWTSTLSRKKKSVKYLVEKLYCFLKG